MYKANSIIAAGSDRQMEKITALAFPGLLHHSGKSEDNNVQKTPHYYAQQRDR